MMNTLIKITFLLAFFYGIKINAQLDTLQYLKTNFEIQKSEYIGKNFSYLLNHMTEIQPKTTWATVGHKGKKYYTLFNFCEMNDSFYDVITLAIEWQEPIPVQQTDYYENKNGFYFTNDEKTFYGSKIVKNIWVYR